jgi:hypothetical protein
MDEGAILYYKQAGNVKAEYAAHCTCKTGEAFNYDGTKCEKHKSTYYIPVVTQAIDPEQLAAENFRKWWEANKNKKGVEKAMQERGIPIPKEVTQR